MNARIPLPDWRDNVTDIPVYSLNGTNMEPSSRTIAEIVEEIDETELEREIMEFVSEQNRRAG
jgi:hypothetical protein